MRARHTVLVASVALLIAACSIGKPIPQATTYVIEPSMPAERIVRKQIAKALRMGNVQMAAAFSGNALVYRTDDVSYRSDPYQTFIADPGAMLGNTMATWLDRSGAFKSVAQPGSTRSAPYVLEATVTELYGDFRPGQAPAAVMAVQFALVDLTGIGPRVVYEGTIERREPLQRTSPDALVWGYGHAVSEILSQFVSELNASNVR